MCGRDESPEIIRGQAIGKSVLSQPKSSGQLLAVTQSSGKVVGERSTQSFAVQLCTGVTVFMPHFATIGSSVKIVPLQAFEKAAKALNSPEIKTGERSAQLLRMCVLSFSLKEQLVQLRLSDEKICKSQCFFYELRLALRLVCKMQTCIFFQIAPFANQISNHYPRFFNEG